MNAMYSLTSASMVSGTFLSVMWVGMAGATLKMGIVASPTMTRKVVWLIRISNAILSAGIAILLVKVIDACLADLSGKCCGCRNVRMLSLPNLVLSVAQLLHSMDIGLATGVQVEQ